MNTAFVFYTTGTNQYTLIYAGSSMIFQRLQSVISYCKRKHIGVRMYYF